MPPLFFGFAIELLFIHEALFSPFIYILRSLEVTFNHGKIWSLPIGKRTGRFEGVERRSKRIREHALSV